MKFAICCNEGGQEGVEYSLEHLSRDQFGAKSGRLDGPDHDTDFIRPDWVAHRSASPQDLHNTTAIPETGGVSPRRLRFLADSTCPSGRAARDGLVTTGMVGDLSSSAQGDLPWLLRSR
ncbi:MAG TPA: hypothetical protein VFE63_05035 [Roseiarcus sp.]|nr:hypothetical protein [Roseiarcus sp.]